MLFNWFSKKTSLPPLDFSILNTDIHSHIIPGIDDGSPDMVTSLLLLKELQNLGFRQIITTPHVMSDFYQNTKETIINGLSDLVQQKKQEHIAIEIKAAAEYYVDYNFYERFAKEQLLTFGDNFVLVEFSFLESPRNLEELIFQLQSSGYRVVLAHPERYSYLNINQLAKLSERGVLLQANLLSLVGHYSASVTQKAKQLIDANLISFVGTDCHHLQHIEKLKECFTNPLWHQLAKSSRLLNKTL